MTNAQSKMKNEAPRESFAIGRKQCGEWYADFGKNYPLTQKYAQERMVGNIQHWTPEVITFVILQTTGIAMGVKMGKWEKYVRNETSVSTEDIIDVFTSNYLKNALNNINNLYYACGDWNIVLSGLMKCEALKADGFIEKAIKKYGYSK
jgi:hypothetical protein